MQPRCPSDQVQGFLERVIEAGLAAKTQLILVILKSEASEPGWRGESVAQLDCPGGAIHTVDCHIVDGLRRSEPGIDIVDVKTSGLRGSKDPVLLELAARQNRVLIAHDRGTMKRHYELRHQ